MDVITYPCQNWSQPMLIKKAPGPKPAVYHTHFLYIRTSSPPSRSCLYCDINSIILYSILWNGRPTWHKADTNYIMKQWIKDACYTQRLKWQSGHGHNVCIYPHSICMTVSFQRFYAIFTKVSQSTWYCVKELKKDTLQKCNYMYIYISRVLCQGKYQGQGQVSISQRFCGM